MLKIYEVNRGIRELVQENGGFCPCAVIKSEDTKCPCKEFREQAAEGQCHCGRFAKVSIDE